MSLQTALRCVAILLISTGLSAQEPIAQRSGDPATPRVIEIETTADVEQNVVLRKVVELLKNERAAKSVLEDRIGKPVGFLAQISARPDTPFESLQQLIKALRDAGIEKFALRTSNEPESSVAVTAPADASWRQVRRIEEVLAKHSQFAGRVLVAENNDPVTPTITQSPVITGARSLTSTPDDELASPSAAPQKSSRPAPTEVAPATLVKVFALKNSHAATVARIIEQLYGREFSAAADERTNSLIVRGPDKRIQEIEALLMRVDDAAAPAPSGSSGQPETSPAGSGFKVHVPALGPTPLSIDLNGGASPSKVFSFNVGISRESADELRKRSQVLEQQSRELAEQLKGPFPNPSEAEKKKELLRSTVQQAFAARQALLRAENAELAKRLHALQQSIEIRDRVSQQIIDRRIDDLLNPHKQWNAESPVVPESKSKQPEISVLSKPQTGVVPATSARTASDAAEQLRAKLGESIEVEIDDDPLWRAVYAICNPKMIEFDLNKAKISEAGIQVDAPLALKGKGSLRELFRRLLEPHGLAYIVHDSFIEITTKQDAENRPTTRWYDITFLTKTGPAFDLLSLTETIETTVYPDAWVTVGGVSSLKIVGSLLVAKATDPAHEQIEKLLDKLAQTHSAQSAIAGPEKLPRIANAPAAATPYGETSAAELPAGDENKLLIRRSETSVTVEGRFDGNEEILLVIGDPRSTSIANTAPELKDVKELKSTSPVHKAGDYVIEVRQDVVKIGGGGTAPGLVFQVHNVPNTVQSTSNISFTDKDPLPNGKVVIASPKTKLLLKRKTDHVIVTVGHVELPDALNVVPINIVIRRRAGTGSEVKTSQNAFPAETHVPSQGEKDKDSQPIRSLPGDTAAKLVARLQGEWKAKSVDHGNGPMLGEQEIVIRDHVGIIRYFQGGKLVLQSSFAVTWPNPGRPQEVDVTIDPNSGEHEPWPGLIECDGKILRLCCRGDMRPRELCPGDEVFYVECTKNAADTESKKSDATSSTVAPASDRSVKPSGIENTSQADKGKNSQRNLPGDTAAKLVVRLQGQWKVKFAEIGGLTVPNIKKEIEVRDRLLLLKLLQPEGVMSVSSWRLSWPDENRPDEVDVTFDPNSGVVPAQLGRIECDGKSFRLCFNDGENKTAKRPLELCPGESVCYLEGTKETRTEQPVPPKPQDKLPDDKADDSQSEARSENGQTKIAIGKIQYSLPFSFPSVDSILNQMTEGKARRKHERIECKLVKYQVSEARHYPLVGPAQLVQTHFKSTVTSEADREVVYSDSSHLIRLPPE